MKYNRFLLLLICNLVIAISIYGQKTVYYPSKVVKAQYFRKTLPLREMKVILPGDRDRSWKDGVIPPDTDGDVGPDHYFQMINLSFAIWDKEGNKLFGPVDNSTLWNGFIGPWTGTNDGDPIVLYDEMADRWLASQFAIFTSSGTFALGYSISSDTICPSIRYTGRSPEAPLGEMNYTEIETISGLGSQGTYHYRKIDHKVNLF